MGKMTFTDSQLDILERLYIWSVNQREYIEKKSYYPPSVDSRSAKALVEKGILEELGGYKSWGLTALGFEYADNLFKDKAEKAIRYFITNKLLFNYGLSNHHALEGKIIALYEGVEASVKIHMSTRDRCWFVSVVTNGGEYIIEGKHNKPYEVVINHALQTQEDLDQHYAILVKSLAVVSLLNEDRENFRVYVLAHYDSFLAQIQKHNKENS